MIARRSSVLRVFVGTSPRGEDDEACAALEASMRARASVPLDVTYLRQSDDPASPCSGWNTEQWSTPWTALRWLVPEMCDWRGRAVYLDCPSLVLGDVAELAAAKFPPGAFLLARREAAILTGCLVFNCASARGWVSHLPGMRGDVGAHQAVGELLREYPVLLGGLPEGWGWSDRYHSQVLDAAGARSVHFLSPYMQPHGPLADARLAREGRRHWFGGVRLPHYNQRLVDLWRGEYARVAAHA